MTIKELKRGQYFTLKNTEHPKENQVYIRGDYDRTTKKYECFKFSDVNETRYYLASKEVFTDFVF